MESGEPKGIWTRRRLLLGAWTLALSRLYPGRALAAGCGPTPPQTVGPFYPFDWDAPHDTDLSRLFPDSERVETPLVRVRGRVLDLDCGPIVGARVDLWQANAAGSYHHPRDRNPAPHDPNFQYRGRCRSGVDGTFSFTTIKPGAYPAAPGWSRPPHIHFLVEAPDFPTLTTQMYFQGEPLNRGDGILEAIPARARSRVLVPFETGPGGSLEGQFDIVLHGRHPSESTPHLE